jgi:predicted dienelactone hydrolase
VSGAGPAARRLLCLLGSLGVLSSCESYEPRQPPVRPGKVGRQALGLEDASRRSWDQSGPRPLATVVWYPAEGSAREEEWLIGPPWRPLFRAGWSALDAPLLPGPDPLPLLLLSHGTGGAAPQLAWLAEHFACRGFLVAAVNHHGNTAAEEKLTPQGFYLWWERAVDLTRVLDALLADPRWGPRIDRGRIGAAGFSLGGFTVLALAGAETSLSAFEAFCTGPQADTSCQAPPEFPDLLEEVERIQHTDPLVVESLRRHGESYRDSRVRATYAIAPALGMAFTEVSLRAISVPVRIASGDADEIVPPETNGRRVASLIPGASFETVSGGVSHYTFLAECTPQGQRLLPICRDGQGVDRGAVHRQVAEDALAFFAKVFAASQEASR